MDATTIILERLDAYMARVEEVIDDVTEAELMTQPGDQDNPIGWLMWHMTRFEDRTIAQITGGAQAWTEGKWHEQFGVAEEPDATGVGQTLGQVMSLKPTREGVMGYYRATREKTTTCLSGLTDKDLDREIDDFFGRGKIAIGMLLGRLFGDHISHIGQICYLRGHLKGWGRYGR